MIANKHTFLPFLFCLIISTASAQVSSIDSVDQKLVNWYNKDLKNDKIAGVSTEKAYRELIQNTPAETKTIVVAIIDSGVDIEHEDLQGKIWINEGEIAGNQIDDDGNGYIDDIHGWNFIGNKNGENIHLENFEYTRVYRKYNERFQNVSSTDELDEADLEVFATYKKSKYLYEKNLSKYKQEEEGISMFEEIFHTAKEIIKTETGLSPTSVKELKSIRTKSKRTSKAISFLIDKYKMGLTEDKLAAYKSHNYECLNMHLNVDFTPREIIGDNPADIRDAQYGNNDVVGPRADHGTSVAGVVAANRQNGIGIDGIAENVKLMILRTIPKGDEYDKDVALAIRYAADNGAHIINMSFGKEMSPNKEFVDSAIQYAESKNILMVHASGNSGINVDVEPRFPSDICNDGKIVSSWLDIGASTLEHSSDIVASFSNYGKKQVDLFAPGKDIVSLEPGNQYSVNDGTSLASPIVSGVAALVWSHYPSLTANELKQILMQSAYKVRKPKVLLPDGESEKREKGKFAQLSVSGGIVNAYEAMLLAKKMTEKK